MQVTDDIEWAVFVSEVIVERCPLDVADGIDIFDATQLVDVPESLAFQTTQAPAHRSGMWMNCRFR